nr:molybdopterin-dependent oxidoreductase [Bacteroidota bacterium]
MKVRRRDFLKTMGAVGVGMFVFSPALGAFEKNSGSKTLTTDNWVASTCQGCTSWCSVEVLVQEDGTMKRAVKVRGNNNAMTNPGTVCPKAHMIPQQMYDPDRLKVPMKRTNPVKGKGIDPGFVPITWDDAMTELASKMMELRAADETHKFLFMRGRYSYSRDILYYALPKIFGSPNAISHSALCAEAEKAGPYFTEHYWGYRDYDLDNTKYLVLWGVDPFRSNRQPPTAMSKWETLLA